MGRGVGRLRGVSDAQRELTGPSGLLSLVYDRMESGTVVRILGQELGGLFPQSVCLSHHQAGLFPHVEAITLNVVVLEVGVGEMSKLR